MNIVFLDYDGVVNTPLWDERGECCSFAYPSDNKVNNFQCVQWVSKFCQDLQYSIVVTSTWRRYPNYIDCLTNGGLRKSVQVIGKTDIIFGATREEEIQRYISDHSDITAFLIFDDLGDDVEMGPLSSHLVKCETDIGFGRKEYDIAVALHNEFYAGTD